MKRLDFELFDEVRSRAEASPRRRMHYDLRDSEEEQTMRMLNVLMRDTVIPVHRHTDTSEIVTVVRGRVQEDAYKEVIKTAVGGAAGVIKAVDSATTDCQPNDNIEALRVFMLGKKVECRPVWKPMHKQPVYAGVPVYTNGVEEDIFKIGFCLPAGPYVSDDDVRYIVDCIKEAIAE